MTRRVSPNWPRRSIGIVCFGSALMAAAVLAPGASGRVASAATAAKCRTSQLEVWLGDGLGGGVLGGYYYPLELSNVSHHSCSLNGYPKVIAYRGAGTEVGPAGMHTRQRHRTVTLAPGATAHAQLRITDWGALCLTEVGADGLEVSPPGRRSAQPITFPFGACANSTVLKVGPVRRGVGIPAYTTS